MFQTDAGVTVPFPEKLSEQYELDGNTITANLSFVKLSDFVHSFYAELVEPLEQVIDTLKEQMRTRHILRMQQGHCSIEAGCVWSDLLTNLERTSDHCSNIAVRMVGMEAGDDYDSHTLKNIMHHSPSKDYMLEYEQCRKEYLVPLEEMEA